MTTTRPTQPSTRTDAFRGVTLLVVVVAMLGLLMRGCDDEPPQADAEAASNAAAPKTTARATSTPAATTTSEQVRVPDVTGVRLDEATEELRSYGKAHGVWDGYPSSHDLSPRDRSQWENANWTVALTRPAAGEVWRPGTELHLFVLRNAEWAWFQAHPAMPAVPVDVVPDDLTGQGQLFEGVRELMEYRYAPGHAPEYASPPYVSPHRPIEGLADDPSIEPTSETQERDVLPDASSYGLTVGSLPTEGAALRVGQLLTLTVRDKPSEPVPPARGGGADVDVGGSYSDDDDDVNVPGWLCPTRFC
jgi:hypothetical protein